MAYGSIPSHIPKLRNSWIIPAAPWSGHWHRASTRLLPLLEDRQCSVCCPTWGPPVQCCRWRLYLLLDRALRCPISRPAPPPQEIWKHDLQQRTRTKLGPSWDWQHKCEPGAGYFYSYSRTTGDSTIHLPQKDGSVEPSEAFFGLVPRRHLLSSFWVTIGCSMLQRHLWMALVLFRL